jgi:hypothetical protein
MLPGTHVIVIGQAEDAIAARKQGLQLRDTVLILLPGPKEVFAFLFRQPLEGTVAQNVLNHGVGGLWIDGCRISTTEGLNGGAYSAGGRAAPMPGDDRVGSSLGMYEPKRKAQEYKQPSGRWPTNLLLVHGPNCRPLGTSKVRTSSHSQGFGKSGSILKKTPNNVYGRIASAPYLSYVEAGTETVASWKCQLDCPVGILDKQSGSCGGSPGLHAVKKHPRTSSKGSELPHVTQGFSDSGGASRFYPQFASFPEALDWLTMLTGQPAS